MEEKRWKPEVGERYWRLTATIEVIEDFWRKNCEVDTVRFDSGNCFKTKEEAEAAAEKVKALLLSLHDNEQNLDDKEEIPKQKLTADVFKRLDCPEWCKEGEWVYTCNGDYRRVEAISDSIVSLTGGLNIPVGDIHSELVKARLRPYNAEEMKALVGKVIEDKIGNRCLITVFTVVDAEIVVFNSYCSVHKLFELGYTIDGKPCGVFEHLENGEWVN